MRLLRPASFLLAGALLAPAALPAPAQVSSPAPFSAGAVETAGATVRLTRPEQAPGDDGSLLAGVEITLPPGSKTYWRTPGETGVPPVFSFDGSAGITAPEVLFPAPVGFDDGVGGVAYGYHRRVIFPVRFRKAAAGPARLDVRIDFGVCTQSMCVPAHAALSTGVGDDEPARMATGIAAAMAQVPAQSAPDAQGPLAILAVKGRLEGDAILIEATVRVPREAAGTAGLFIESDQLYSVTGREETTPETLRFTARAMREAGATSKPLSPLRMTLAVGPEGERKAIETTIDIAAIIGNNQGR